MRRLSLLLVPLVLAAAACGGHSDADAKIRSVIAVAYTNTPPQDCTRVFTPGLLRAKWGGAAGCRRQMRAIASLNPATVRVISIHRQGPVADARLRVNDTDETSKLVLTGDQWQVDDTIGPNGSIRPDNNLPAGG
jgi:hypothetical protein